MAAGAFWFVYAALIRWRYSRVAYFLTLALLQYYVMTHGVRGENPGPFDAFILTHYPPMVFPGLAGLLAGVLWDFLEGRDTPLPVRALLSIALGGISVFFAADVRYALWSSFL